MDLENTANPVDEFELMLNRSAQAATRKLGLVVGGSLSKGLAVKLDAGAPVEEMAVGRYVVIEGRRVRFFGMITDVTLENVNPLIQSMPPDVSDPFIQDVYQGTAVYGSLQVSPMLVFDDQAAEPRPVKTVPGHFSTVRAATEDDMNRVFGGEDDTHFHIGAPLDMEDIPVHIDLQRMAERSIGVFGKSGTGKSFLTRILLAGMIQKNAAVSLIFDMHSDYGWQIQTEGHTSVKGLRQLFPGRVAIFTLDEESSRRRRVQPDHVVLMRWADITPEDLEMLKVTLQLSDQMIGAAYSLRRYWGKSWITTLLNAEKEDLDDLAESTNVLKSSVAALSRRLEKLARFEFIQDSRHSDSAQEILRYLEQGKTVVLEFGRYGNSMEAYILVANYLTRRIHQMYVKRVESALGNKSAEPPPLMIVIEEAHKFLDPQIANQTIFGIIARELRKYNVTLLVVDQRPSGIDEEVMSQIGTRVTALLDNERDINAVLTGVSGASGLRQVLARLDTKQQALLMGHAVPMPVVLQTRTYDETFYRAVISAEGKMSQAERVNLLRGPEDEEEGID